MTALTTHPPSGSLLPAVWKLLGLRLRINVNSFRHAKLRVKIFTVIGLIALLAFAGFIFWLSWILLGFLESPRLIKYVGVDPTPFLNSVPVLIFTGMFMGILLTSFGVLLQALYLSGDMDFLLAAPVPIRAVFMTKLMQAVLPNFGLLALFGLPILYGLGASRGYNFLYYPLVLLIMIALTLAAAGLSSLLVMLVVRIVPARRVAEVLGFVGATFSILCSQSGNLMQFSRHNSDISASQINNLVNLMIRLNSPWLPLNWAGQGLVELGLGNWFLGLLLVILTLGLFIAAFWFALVTAERLYYTGWAGMQVIARKKRQTAVPAQEAKPRPQLFSVLERLISAPIRGIILKDFMLLRRDLRNLSQLVTPLIFGIIYASAFLRGDQTWSGQDSFYMRSAQSLLSYANVGVALFVGWSMLTRLGGMAFSQEGKNYWMLKVSPLNASDLLTAKFLVAYLPALALGGLFMTVISIVRGMSPLSYIYSLLITAMCLAGMAGILVGFGAAGANLTWEDPRKMNAGTLGCVGMILTTVFTAVAFLFFVGPIGLFAFFQWPEIYGYLGGLLAGGSVSAVSVFLPLWLARGRVERLGEA